MRAKQLAQVCEALGVKVGRVSSSWMAVPCPLSPWTHTGGVNSSNARGEKTGGGLSVSDYGKSKYMCHVCQPTPINMWELHQLLEHNQIVNPIPRRLNLNMLRALALQEQENVVDDIEAAAYELQGRNADGSEGTFQDEVRTKVWPEEFTFQFDRVLEAPEAKAYCNARAIPDSVIDHLGLLWDPKQRRICFPIRDEDWQLTGMHGRLVDDYSPLDAYWEGHPDPETLLEQNPNCLAKHPRPPLRYYSYECDGVRNNHIWCNQHIVDLSQPVIITEGNFDYARIMAAGFYNVMGSRSTGIHGLMMKYLKGAQDIITYYDIGAGGDTARAYIDKYFAGSGRNIHHIVPDALNDDAGATPAVVIANNLRRFII